MPFRFILFVLSFLFSACLAHAEPTLKDAEGNDIAFSSLRGKWVLINYWASWCPTCLEEIPEFNRFYDGHKKNSVALYAVNFDGLTKAKQNILAKRFKIQYPSLIKDPSSELQLGDIRGIPVTFIFNPKGELVKTLYGGQTAETLNRVIQKG